jgi:hypothetical protein
MRRCAPTHMAVRNRDHYLVLLQSRDIYCPGSLSLAEPEQQTTAIGSNPVL